MTFSSSSPNTILSPKPDQCQAWAWWRWGSSARAGTRLHTGGYPLSNHSALPKWILNHNALLSRYPTQCTLKCISNHNAFNNGHQTSKHFKAITDRSFMWKFFSFSLRSRRSRAWKGRRTQPPPILEERAPKRRNLRDRYSLTIQFIRKKIWTLIFYLTDLYPFF